MNGFSTLTETRINRMIAAINIAAEKRIRSNLPGSMNFRMAALRTALPEISYFSCDRLNSVTMARNAKTATAVKTRAYVR